MDYSFLSPVKDRLIDQLELFHDQTIGKKLRIHSSTVEPSLEGVKMAIVGVLESRNSDWKDDNSVQDCHFVSTSSVILIRG